MLLFHKLVDRILMKAERGAAKNSSSTFNSNSGGFLGKPTLLLIIWVPYPHIFHIYMINRAILCYMYLKVFVASVDANCIHQQHYSQNVFDDMSYIHKWDLQIQHLKIFLLIHQGCFPIYWSLHVVVCAHSHHCCTAHLNIF